MLTLRSLLFAMFFVVLTTMVSIIPFPNPHAFFTSSQFFIGQPGVSYRILYYGVLGGT